MVSEMSSKPLLRKMSVPDKLRLMEDLWEDLTRNSDALESPAWHGVELEKRRADLAAGKTAYMDWERAKKEIRRSVS